jgi:hypothetical protein
MSANLLSSFDFSCIRGIVFAILPICGAKPRQTAARASRGGTRSL